MFRLTRHLVLVALLGGVSACDQDPFHLAERTVVGRYRLSQWEDEHTYRLVTPETRDSSGGVVGGTVISIGRSDPFIVVKRDPFRPGPTDWMLIDARAGRLLLVSPDSSKVFATAGRSITVMPASQAWVRYGKGPGA